MLCGRRHPFCLWLWLLLLLLLPPPPGARGHGDHARSRDEAAEADSGRAWKAFQRLREHLRAAGALSRRYWALFSCRLWPEACGKDEEAPARPLGKTRWLRKAGARGQKRGAQCLGVQFGASRRP